MLPVSVCIIMKNEERNLGRCLDALHSYPFELILVDTGSTDDTVLIAQQYTDTVYTFPWIRDFAAARNFSLSKASHDWVLVLDCDEVVTKLDVDSLLCFMAENPQEIGLIERRNHYEMNGCDSVYVDQVERFFDRRIYHYEGIIHEQVVLQPTAVQQGILRKRSPISVLAEHSGYVGTPEELNAKSMRNAELLLEELKMNPHDPYLYFQMGQCYNLLHDDEKALHYYRQGLSFDVNPDLEYVQMMVIGYGYALLHLEEYEEALTLANIYDAFSGSADFLCLIGLIYLRTGNLLSAMSEFLKAIACPVAHAEGANSFIPYYNMGCINELLGDINTAKVLYQKCGDFPMAAKKLQELNQM